MEKEVKPGMAQLLGMTEWSPENPKGFGQMDAAAWDAFGAFMKDQQLLDTVAPAADITTNEFLPAQ